MRPNVEYYRVETRTEIRIDIEFSYPTTEFVMNLQLLAVLQRAVGLSCAYVVGSCTTVVMFCINLESDPHSSSIY